MNVSVCQHGVNPPRHCPMCAKGRDRACVVALFSVVLLAASAFAQSASMTISPAGQMSVNAVGTGSTLAASNVNMPNNRLVALLSFQAPVAGMYAVSGTMRYSVNGSGVRRCFIYVNGDIQNEHIAHRPSRTATQPIACMNQLTVNAGDTITFRGSQDSGGPLLVDTALFAVARK